jgi:hypothetical protein
MTRRLPPEIDWPVAIVMVTLLILATGLLILIGYGAITLIRILADVVLRLAGSLA